MVLSSETALDINFTSVKDNYKNIHSIQKRFSIVFIVFTLI